MRLARRCHRIHRDVCNLMHPHTSCREAKKCQPLVWSPVCPSDDWDSPVIKLGLWSMTRGATSCSHRGVLTRNIGVGMSYRSSETNCHYGYGHKGRLLTAVSIALVPFGVTIVLVPTVVTIALVPCGVLYIYDRSAHWCYSSSGSHRCYDNFGPL